MKVICRDYKTCSISDTCAHGRLHDTDINDTNIFLNCTIQDGSVYKECLCSVKNARKYKLENLQKNENR